MDFMEGEKRLVPISGLTKFKEDYRKLSKLLKIKNTKLCVQKVQNTAVVYLEKRKPTQMDYDDDEDEDVKILVVSIHTFFNNIFGNIFDKS